MSKNPNDVVITGIGIVSCHGAGRDAHETLLNAAETP